MWVFTFVHKQINLLSKIVAENIKLFKKILKAWGILKGLVCALHMLEVSLSRFLRFLCPDSQGSLSTSERTPEQHPNNNPQYLWLWPKTKKKNEKTRK